MGGKFWKFSYEFKGIKGNNVLSDDVYLFKRKFNVDKNLFQFKIMWCKNK